MRSTASCRIFLCLALLLAELSYGRNTSASEGSPTPTGLLVETFNGVVVSQADMPGTVTPAGVRFTSTDRFNSVSFAPGSVAFRGKPVDFHGAESAFLGTDLNWNYELLVGPTPTMTDAVADCSGDGAITGAVVARLAEFETGTPTEAGFSASSLNVQQGATVNGYAKTTRFKTHITSIAALNNAIVEAATTGTIDSVDAATGLVMATVTGGIYASARPSVPATPPLGWWLLAIGLIGLGALRLARRTSQST